GVSIFRGSLLRLTVAMRRQEVAAEAVQLGAGVPHFTSVDEHGQPFDSSSLHGHILLIKFFRAHW
ncbi:MAG: hypothetical protein O7E57_11465, partial [Gammaproteobacteria bacterium]|nr:hypothetical protein [Gammaproteobacteria bacterium]